MSGWRQFAEQVRQTEEVGTIGTKGTKPPIGPSFVSIVPIVPKARLDDPTMALKQWHEHLSRLDLQAVPTGLDRRDWWQKCEDACWIYENFASKAVRDGWGAADLFGVLPCRWGWGGLCDRLQGARNLKMCDGIVTWSICGGREWFCRGGGDDLIVASVVPIWELIG